eukprot:COSAG01_NODE_64989_length_274_cov_1.525714_1_plen_31_part_01
MRVLWLPDCDAWLHWLSVTCHGHVTESLPHH